MKCPKCLCLSVYSTFVLDGSPLICPKCYVKKYGAGVPDLTITAIPALASGDFLAMANVAHQPPLAETFLKWTHEFVVASKKSNIHQSDKSDDLAAYKALKASWGHTAYRPFAPQPHRDEWGYDAEVENVGKRFTNRMTKYEGAWRKEPRA